MNLVDFSKCDTSLVGFDGKLVMPEDKSGSSWLQEERKYWWIS